MNRVLYFEADRLSVTRFCYLYALVTPGYATPALVDETLQELRRRARSSSWTSVHRLRASRLPAAAHSSGRGI